MDFSPTPAEARLVEALRENDELRQTLREIESSVAEARAQTEDMERLIYALSHDFRTPLRTMSSYAQLLQRQYASDADANEMTTFIVSGANDMKVLIEDVLKYSRIKTSPDRTTINLQSVVQWAAANLQQRVAETGARISCGDLPEVAVNESQFVQLFEQLFRNSLTYGGADPPVIEVSSEEQADAYLISVRDNGSGIAREYQESVFTPFKRLHGKERPGTGMGLTICRKIVRAHGGRIWVESDGQHGSDFRFTVPF